MGRLASVCRVKGVVPGRECVLTYRAASNSGTAGALADCAVSNPVPANYAAERRRNASAGNICR
jgi:hypothetical protein